MIDDDADEMRAESDFSGGARGKYYRQVSQGTNVVLLEDDVSQLFPTAAAVNEALRLVMQITQIPQRAAETTNDSLQPAT